MIDTSWVVDQTIPRLPESELRWPAVIRTDEYGWVNPSYLNYIGAEVWWFHRYWLRRRNVIRREESE